MLRFLAKGVFVVVVLYGGWTLGYPYFQYLMMQWAVEEAVDLGAARVEVARRGPWSEESVMREVRARVIEVMQGRGSQVGIKLSAQGVKVVLEADRFRVGTAWEAEAELAGYVQRYQFSVEGRRVLTH